MQKSNYLTSLFSIMVYLLALSTAFAQTRLTGTVNALAITENDGLTMYAGTHQGLYLSRDNGHQWTSIGLDERSINDIAVHPANRSIIYAAAGNDGVVKTTNGSKQWDILDLKLPGSKGHGDIRAVAIDPSSPSILYAASFQGYLFKSTDEGQSWSTLNPDFPLQALNAVAIDPADGNVLYVGTGGNGIYKSVNGGSDWSSINNNLTDLSVTRVVIDPADPATLYVGTYGGGVYISRDYGQSWNPANTGLTDKYVYALAAYPQPLAGGKKEGLLDRLQETITGGKTSLDKTGLLIGVYGGTLFRASGNGDLHWQLLAGKQAGRI